MAIKNKYVLEFNSKGVKKTKSDVDSLNTSQNKLAKNSKKIKAGLAVVGVAIAAMGTYAINTAAQFEKLRTRLNTMYGSVNKGTKAFQTFNKIAATTPFAVKNVVEAGAALKAFGMDAEKNIKGVADLAAFMGVDVVEAAQAMGRAFAGGAGAADVLRERGVLELIKSFKGVDDLTKLTLPEFREALEEAITDPTLGISGATSALSETFEGAYSNMMDSVDRLASKMGDALLRTVKNVVRGMTSFINSMIDNGDVFEQDIRNIRQEEKELRKMTSAIINGNIPQQARIEKLQTLKREYPDFLSNIKAENATNEDIEKSLKGINEQNDIRIASLIQERMLKKLLDEENELLDNQFDSYLALTQEAENIGAAAREVMETMALGGGQFFIEGSADFVGLDEYRQNKEVVRELALEVSGLYDQYMNNKIGAKEYIKSLLEIMETETLSVGKYNMKIKGFRRLNSAQHRYNEDTKILNTTLDQNRATIEDLTGDIDTLKTTLENTTTEGTWENFKEAVNESFRNTELPNFLSNIEKIPIVATRASEEGLKGFAKFSGKFHNFLKDSNKDMIGFAGTTIDAMGSIGMAAAGDDKSRLKVQKAMVIGNVAKGIIDIWTSPAPSNPLQTARAVAASAALVAQGVSQRKAIDQQIAEIDSAKGEIGQSGAVTFAQYGMNQVVDGATPIVAGEAGAELVQITPLEGPNVNGPQGSSSIIISGNVLSREFVREELADEIREAIRQGYDFT